MHPNPPPYALSPHYKHLPSIYTYSLLLMQNILIMHLGSHIHVGQLGPHFTYRPSLSTLNRPLIGSCLAFPHFFHPPSFYHYAFYHPFPFHVYLFHFRTIFHFISSDYVFALSFTRTLFCREKHMKILSLPP